MATDTASPSRDSLQGNLKGLIAEMRELAHDHLELATLETRLSVDTLLRMGVIAIFIGLVAVSGWLALVGSAALALVSMGMAPVLAMLLLAAANVMAAVLGWMRIRSLSHRLGGMATQRAIRSGPPSPNDSASAQAQPGAA